MTKGGDETPAQVPLSVPETRRLIMAMGEPRELRTFRLGRSY